MVAENWALGVRLSGSKGQLSGWEAVPEPVTKFSGPSTYLRRSLQRDMQMPGPRQKHQLLSLLFYVFLTQRTVKFVLDMTSHN